jgi:hypothetical protein
MIRLYFTLTVALAAGVVRADVAPPPGQKRVPVDYVIETGTEFKDYVFFAVIGFDEEWTKRLEIRPGTPAKVPGAGRGGRARVGTLIAVPASAEKDFKSADEFKKAAVRGEITGILKAEAGLESLETIPESDKRTVIERRYKIEKLDPTKGIVTTEVGAKVEEPKKPGGLSRGEILAGCCAALGLAGLGIWLVRRGRGEWMK